MITQTPAKVFLEDSVTAVTAFETEAVQTSLLLKYFIITNNAAAVVATFNLYIVDVNGNLTHIAPTITLQGYSAGYNISLIESEGNVVLYPKQKIRLTVTAGDVSAVFSLIPISE